MSTGRFTIPVSNGLLSREHQRKIGPSIWVFLWLLDHITKEQPGTDQQTEGLVFSGAPLKLSQVAEDLGISLRSVQGHISRLCDGGYIRKLGDTTGNPSGYAVSKSKKWRVAKSTDTAQEFAHPRKNLREDDENVRGSRKNSLPNKEYISKQPIQGEHFNPQEAAMYVKQTLSLNGRDCVRDVADAIDQMVSIEGLTPRRAAELMVERWERNPKGYKSVWFWLRDGNHVTRQKAPSAGFGGSSLESWNARIREAQQVGAGGQA